MSDFQFYPTPSWLAEMAIGLFESPIKCLLEPSAGRGDLIAAAKARRVSWKNYKRPVFAVEADQDNQKFLRGMGVAIVGHDFLALSSARGVSHILMNPPFNAGAEHVLHAWELLEGGEIAAIINAETLLNPYSAKRKQLLKLIEDFGSFTVINDAFSREKGVIRPANVDVALVYLSKKIDSFKLEFEAKKDQKTLNLDAFEAGNSVGFAAGKIQSFVRVFNHAVDALESSLHHKNAEIHFSSMLNNRLFEDILAQEKAELDDDGSDSIVFTSDLGCDFTDGYLELKRKAWTAVIHGSGIEESLSNENKKRLYNEIDNICQLEFTTENIHSFFCGFSAAKPDLDNDMLCGVFDIFTKYHHENRCYYKGWKSNTAHRLNAFKLKAKRIVLPINIPGCYSLYVDHRSVNMLEDIERGFMFLDGKVFNKETSEIQRYFGSGATISGLIGERNSMQYFDFRIYAGGTIHLFPKRKDLIERLNRVVGKLRQWLPENENEASGDYWEHFDKAEKINASLSKETLNDINRLSKVSGYYHGIFDEDAAAKRASECFDKAAQSLGIKTDNLLTSNAVKKYPALLESA